MEELEVSNIIFEDGIQGRADVGFGMNCFQISGVESIIRECPYIFMISCQRSSPLCP